jgi:hypothetical protein
MCSIPIDMGLFLTSDKNIEDADIYRKFAYTKSYISTYDAFISQNDALG